MTNKYSLNIYPRAQADLDDILRYISDELWTMQKDLQKANMKVV